MPPLQQGQGCDGAVAVVRKSSSSSSSSLSPTPPSATSSSSSSTTSSQSSKMKWADLAQIASLAAQKVEHDFDKRSALVAGKKKKSSSSSSSSSSSPTTATEASPTKLVALVSPDELLLSTSGVFDDGGKTTGGGKGKATGDKEASITSSSSSSNNSSNSNQPYLISHLDGICLSQDVEFDDEDIEETRERFAERTSYENYFAVKFVNPSLFSRTSDDGDGDGDGNNAHSPERIEQRKKLVQQVSSSLVLECKILSNLEKKHPHISQVYATTPKGCTAGFGHRVLEDNFFIVTDEIKETLSDRVRSWRNKQSYEAERFDDQERSQSEVTQRLEVGLDIASALAFLSNRRIVYLLNPSKVGFDTRMGRIKLFCFGTAFEDGEKPFVTTNPHDTDMKKLVYCAPEVLRQDSNMKGVTVSADSYSFGILLWEILILKHPFQFMSREKYLSDVAHGNTRPNLSRHMSTSLQQLMGKCWVGDPEGRLAMKDIHDQLEGLLLEGSNLTVGRTEEKSPARPKSKRIVSNKADDEDNLKDAANDGKSIRSADHSRRSRESHSREKKTTPTEVIRNETKYRSHRHGHSHSHSHIRQRKEQSEDGHSANECTKISAAASNEKRRRSSERDIRTRSRSKSLTRSPRKSKESSQEARSSRIINYEKDEPCSHDDPNESRSATSGGSTRSGRSHGSNGSKGSNDSKSFRHHSSRRGTRPTEDERASKSHRDLKGFLTSNKESSGNSATDKDDKPRSPAKTPDRRSGGRIRRSVSNDIVLPLKKVPADDEGRRSRLSRRTKSFTGQFSSRTSPTRTASPKQVSRRPSSTMSMGKDDADTKPTPSHEPRRRIAYSLSPSAERASGIVVPSSSRPLMKGVRSRTDDPSNAASENFTRRAPGRSISNAETAFARKEFSQRKPRSFRPRTSESETLLREKSTFAAKSLHDLTFLKDDIEDKDEDEDEIFPEFSGSNKQKKDLTIGTNNDDGHNDGTGEDDRRGRLKATASGGLIMINAKDKNLGGSMSRQKFLSEQQKQHQQQAETGMVSSSLREMQRRQQYNQSVAAAAAAAKSGSCRFLVGSSRRDLMMTNNNNKTVSSKVTMKAKSKRTLISSSSRNLLQHDHP
eukprot:CAMPEP_0113456100 /NCGR_PEP_ID=MMETSP0014_2-20120614/8712_1 /TAXON_ID=2857 /ORGANISM="Nitzschia sp." /LENGTH=1108 /DNA_ID=CAMNT_0000347541 /DNA_START=262 /DNA_END=3586 /DNA_ORIENTATION=- /assembly_acc=CAM_ASM_000159